MPAAKTRIPAPTPLTDDELRTWSGANNAALGADGLLYKLVRYRGELLQRRGGTPNHPAFYSHELPISELERAVALLAKATADAMAAEVGARDAVPFS